MNNKLWIHETCGGDDYIDGAALVYCGCPGLKRQLMTLRFKCNVDNEYHAHTDPLDLQDVLVVVAAQNLGKMKKDGVAPSEIAKHVRVNSAI